MRKLARADCEARAKILAADDGCQKVICEAHQVRLSVGCVLRTHPTLCIQVKSKVDDVRSNVTSLVDTGYESQIKSQIKIESSKLSQAKTPKGGSISLHGHDLWRHTVSRTSHTVRAPSQKCTYPT